MENQEGKLVSTKEEILEVFKEFYDQLFEKEPVDDENVKNEIEEKVKRIQERAKNQIPMKIEIDEIRKTARNLKNRKAGDSEGWKNETIKYGGEEMIKSLSFLYN